MPLPPFAAQHLPAGTRLGLAVSGGADSVALLRLAHGLAPQHGWALQVFHIDHGLRGAASREDALFVRELAGALGLQFSLLEGDAAALSRSEGIGLEEGCRLLRYRWFGELLASRSVDAVATGHTLDDQAETVLGKFLRGAWTAGLGGIHPMVEAADLPGAVPASTGRVVGRVVRPLLEARGADLRAWLTALGQPWREDETNRDPAFTRNRIRHEVLPVLEQMQPQIAVRLAQTGVLAREDEQFWQAETARVLPGLLLPGRPVRGGGRASSTMPGEQSFAVEVERLRALPPALARRVLRAIAAKLGAKLAFAETDRAFQLLGGPVGAAGRRVELSAELRAERTPRELRFVRIGAAPSLSADISISVPGEGSGFGVRLQLTHVSGEPQPPATLRAARPADRVQLRYSRGAPKRVKEVLERMGVPPPERGGWPLLEWAGEIVWLRGAVLEPTPAASQLVIRADVSGG